MGRIRRNNNHREEEEPFRKRSDKDPEEDEQNEHEHATQCVVRGTGGDGHDQNRAEFSLRLVVVSASTEYLVHGRGIKSIPSRISAGFAAGAETEYEDHEEAEPRY